MSLPPSPHVRIMARSPMLGLEFRRFSPCDAITRFSSITGTMSAANAYGNEVEHTLKFGSRYAIADRECLHKLVAHAAARQMRARIYADPSSFRVAYEQRGSSASGT